ncbi:MAG: farnesyl diphosphate synthase [Pseudomonadota bacterium]
MGPDTFERRLGARAQQTEATLERLLPQESSDAGRVAAAMRYAALGGGKRLRAFLALESAALFNVPEAQAERAAAALECVHAYSLVHDDLPAMDDDDLRRGRATTHIAYDEATAILAGDALQTIAFEILAAPETHGDAEVRCALIADLAKGAGAEGMVGGQMLDIEAEAAAAERVERQDPDAAMAEIERLQSLKTGRLITAACLAGARLGGASTEETAALRSYSDRLGLAFQIADDLLDVEGDEEAAGKRLQKDAAAGKATFVGLLGVDGARQAARSHADEAIASLTVFGDAAAPLSAAAEFTISRKA